MIDTEIVTFVPEAMKVLASRGDAGMTREEFFKLCRELDKESSPLSALQVLYKRGCIKFIDGSKPLKLRISIK